MTKKKAKEIPFHPLAEEYPLMPAHDMGRLEEAMRLRGFDPRFPIVLYKKQILDGRNRYKAAMAAGVEPVFTTFKGDDDAARLFVQLANEERRHLAIDWLKRRREERVARVVEARKEGKSTRQIAEEEGVSHTQVKRDLKEANPGGTPVPPETAPPAADGAKQAPETPEKVTGKDGKAYPASKPKVEEKPATEKPVEVDPVAYDCLGIPLADLAMIDVFDSLAGFKAARTQLVQLAKVVADLATQPGGAVYASQLRGRANGDDELRHYCEHLKNARNKLLWSEPYSSVCPYCHHHGKGVAKSCKACHGLGWVTKQSFENAPKDYQAKVLLLVKKEDAA